MWKINSLQTSISHFAFLNWLENGQLLSMEEAEALLGGTFFLSFYFYYFSGNYFINLIELVSSSVEASGDGPYFNLEIENYLIGVTFLPSELVRLFYFFYFLF